MWSDENSKITIYSIYIHPSDIRKINRDVWEDEFVPAVLKVDEKRFDVKIGYRGHSSRKYPKKSYDILLPQHPFFHGATEIHLNAEYTDISLLRNKLSLDFFNEIGVVSPKSTHVFLRINGETKGVYLQIESFDEVFLKERKMPIGPIFYAINDDANFSILTPEKKVKKKLEDGYFIKAGIDHDLTFLRELIFFINSASSEDFCHSIEKYINIENYLKWLAGIVCVQNFDGFIHNYSLYLNTETNKFEIAPWDCNGTWGRDINGELLSYDYIPFTGYNTLTARILDTPSFKEKYHHILRNIVNSTFTSDTLRPILMNLHTNLRQSVLKDPFIKDKVNLYDQELDIILKYVEDRRTFILEKINTMT